jgi:hypothetical protein
VRLGAYPVELCRGRPVAIAKEGLCSTEWPRSAATGSNPPHDVRFSENANPVRYANSPAPAPHAIRTVRERSPGRSSTRDSPTSRALPSPGRSKAHPKATP